MGTGRSVYLSTGMDKRVATIHWAPQPRLTGVLTRLFVGGWNGRMWGQGHDYITYFLGQELAGIRSFCCSLKFALNPALISARSYLIFWPILRETQILI